MKKSPADISCFIEIPENSGERARVMKNLSARHLNESI